MSSQKFNVWLTSSTGRNLDEEKFLAKMRRHWNRWGSDLSKEEICAWKDIVDMVCTADIQTIDDMAAPEYWAEVTALKVLFPNEFLQSRHAAIAQSKFPNANINEWKPNEHGPTTHGEFKKNKYVLQESRDSTNAKVSDMLQRTLEKRPWCSKTGDDTDEESPRKRRRLSDSHSHGEADVESNDPQRKDSVFTPDTDNPEEMRGAENLGDVETQLASIRKAAEESTQISPQTIDFLRYAYHVERKKERKAQDDEMSTLRNMYESVVSTFIKGSIDGMKALRIVHRDISKRKKNKKIGPIKNDPSHSTA
ncbi:hypothetical protein FGRMN_8334 [Fusarium graminum]|nr:hypothetical protein FGRMN_8334 [Fusarium graminum]